MKKLIAMSLVALAVGIVPASAKSGVKIGTLSCDVAGGLGAIIGSSKKVHCKFKGSGHTEYYTGRLGKLGIDIGYTGETSMVWVVFAPGKVNRGALAGEYGGASAEATIGVGLGANVLVGGFHKTIALQPLSVQGQTGLNVAAGLAGLKLKYVK
jgi:hypothetical protein